MYTNFRTCCAAEFYRIGTAHEVLTSVCGQTLAHYLEHARADRRTKSFGGRRATAASVLQHRDACCKSAAEASVSAAALAAGAPWPSARAASQEPREWVGPIQWEPGGVKLR